MLTSELTLKISTRMLPECTGGHGVEFAQPVPSPPAVAAGCSAISRQTSVADSAGGWTTTSCPIGVSACTAARMRARASESWAREKSASAGMMAFVGTTLAELGPPSAG